MKSTITSLGITLAFPFITLADSTLADEGADLLRFSEKANHDTLHGTLISLGDADTLIFKSAEASEPTKFSTKKLRRITLNRGNGKQPLNSPSHVTLINGDVIPGTILTANDQNVTLGTEHLGKLTIPTNTISTISPTPHGGKLLYYGPLNAEEWEKISPPTKTKEEDKERAKKKSKDTPLTDWKFFAGAWYTGTDRERYLVRKDSLSDACKIKFKINWRGSLQCNVAIHADLSPPIDKTEKNNSSNMAATLGKSYVIALSSHSATLYQCTFSGDGAPETIRVGQSYVNINLSRKNEADIEIRTDRSNNTLMLYVNGHFKSKWDLGDKYAAPGNAIAFKNLHYSNSKLRISEILITKWNGMRDSAISMQSTDRDTILLTNGLDRFSGDFQEIKNGNILFKGTFNNDISIPLTSVKEIKLASSKLRKIEDHEDERVVQFYLKPFGRISGIPSAEGGTKTKINSSVIGNLSLDMKYVGIIDFTRQNNLSNFWDENF